MPISDGYLEPIGYEPPSLMNGSVQRWLIFLLASSIIILTTLAFQLTQTFYKDFIRGRLLLEKNRYDEALPYYKKAYEKRPGHPEVCEGLLLLYEKLGQIDPAIVLLKQMTAKSPFDFALQERLADTYYRGKKFAETETIYRKILTQEKNPVLLEKLARVLVWQKKYQEALPLLRELMLTHPQDGTLVEFAADVTAWAKDPEQAAALYAKAIQFFPERPELLIKRADQLRYAGHNEEALKIYEQYAPQNIK